MEQLLSRPRGYAAVAISAAGDGADGYEDSQHPIQFPGLACRCPFGVRVKKQHQNLQAWGKGWTGRGGCDSQGFRLTPPGPLFARFRVRDRAQKHRFSDQRRAGDFQRKAQADMSAPLLVPDKGAWPRLLREPVLCSWVRMRSAVAITGLTQRGPFETILWRENGFQPGGNKWRQSILRSAFRLWKLRWPS